MTNNGMAIDVLVELNSAMFVDVSGKRPRDTSVGQPVESGSVMHEHKAVYRWRSIHHDALLRYATMNSRGHQVF